MTDPTPLEKRVAKAVNAEMPPDLDDVATLLGVVAALRQRAEQAERERDEACSYMSAYKDARERAEADNAALLDVLRCARDPHAYGSCGSNGCTCGVVMLLDADHPGTALLERMRALEGVVKEAVTWMRADGGVKELAEPCSHSGACKWQRGEAIISRALDALKERP